MRQLAKIELNLVIKFTLDCLRTTSGFAQAGWTEGQSAVVQIQAAVAGRPILSSVHYKKLDQFSKPVQWLGGRNSISPPAQSRQRWLQALSFA
jgi:hypothetical protein